MPVIVKKCLKLGGQEIAETKPGGMKGSSIDCAIDVVSYISKNDITSSMANMINIFILYFCFIIILTISHIDNTGRSKAYKIHCFN